MTRSSSLKSVLAMALVALALCLSPARAQEGAHPAPPGTLENAIERNEAEHGEHAKAGVLPKLEEGIVPSIVALIVFAGVIAIISTKVWPKINSGLSDRADKIREEIAAAEAARKQAKEALEQYERSLAEARAEAARMLEDTRKQQQVMADELRAKADVELSQMRDRARKDIEAAKRAAVSEIYTVAATMATTIAGKILQREVSGADQKRLIEESLGELQAAGAAS
jgi:F-type H+-transporting ATPase subunit b